MSRLNNWCQSHGLPSCPRFVFALLASLATAVLSAAPTTAAAAPSPYLKQRSNNGSPAVALAQAPDGQLIVAGRVPTVRGLDNQLQHAWERVLDDEFTSTTGLAVRADGALVVAATNECEMQIWRREDPSVQITHTDLKACPLAVVFSPDGHWLVAGCEEGVVQFWDASKWLVDGKLSSDTSGPERTVDLKSDEIHSIALSPDGKRLAVTCGDLTLKTKIVNAATGVVEMELSTTGTALAFSRDGRRLLSGDSVFDTSNWQARFQLNYEFTISGAAFSPDGAWLVTAGNDNRIVFWDARSGKRLAAIRAHDDAVTAIALDARSTTIATGSEDRTVALWDVERILQEKPLAEPFARLANTPEAFDCWRMATDWTRGVLVARNNKRRPPALSAAIERAKRLKITLPELPADLDTEPAVKRVFAEAPKIAAQLKERYG